MTDFIPNFSSEEDEPEGLTDGLRDQSSMQSYRHETPSEGIEVNIYFPEKNDPDQPPGPPALPDTRSTKPPQGDPEQTRPHAFSFPDEPPTRPSIRTPELDDISLDQPLVSPIDELTEAIASAPPESRGERTAHHSPSRHRKGSRLLTILMLLGFFACVALVGWLAWGYQNNALPPQIAALIPTPSNLAIAPTLPATTEGSLLQPTDSPTQRITNTPAVGVTSLPASSEPTRRATPTPRATTPKPTETGAVTQGGLPMIFVPGGVFSMGSSERPAESPVHRVTLDPYYIDQFEVTNAAYAACVDAGECDLPADVTAYDGTPYYGDSDFDEYPVIYVGWPDADAYCQWRGARLPTEAEWEMAARWSPATKNETVFPWGNDWDASRLNYCDSSCLLDDPFVKDVTFDDGWPQMSPVGSFRLGASPVGALDMAGNVAEWVADWYSFDYYANSPAENPAGPNDGTTRVVRGGAWSVDRTLIRSAARSSFGGLTRISSIGFRCAISADDLNP